MTFYEFFLFSENCVGSESFNPHQLYEEIMKKHDLAWQSLPSSSNEGKVRRIEIESKSDIRYGENVEKGTDKQGKEISKKKF